jgi:hypothetical protein
MRFNGPKGGPLHGESPLGPPCRFLLLPAAQARSVRYYTLPSGPPSAILAKADTARIIESFLRGLNSIDNGDNPTRLVGLFVKSNDRE